MNATPHLMKQLQELRKTGLAGFNIEVGEDVFQWTIWFSMPQGTFYYPGQYKAVMSFPQDFPYKPPEFRVLSKMWHPNIYPDGRVCISILHPPGEDEMNPLETASMRWTPVQSIEKVLVSVMSLLSEPDGSDAGAPANVEALVQFRNDRKAFEATCKANAELSLKELPKDYVPPPTSDARPPMQRLVSGYSDGVGAYDDEEDLGADAAESQPRWAEELQQVRNMGLGTELTDEKLLEMLDKFKGDVSCVIDRLA